MLEKMLLTAVFLFIGTSIARGNTLTRLTLFEQQRIHQQLQNTQDTLEGLYYATGSLRAINKLSSDSKDQCDIANDQVDSSNMESIFQYAEVVKASKCEHIKDLRSAILGFVSLEEASSSVLSYAVASMILLRYDVDESITARFIERAKDNDSPASASLSFYTASLLPKSAELKAIVDMVEDIIAQADEIDNRMLQFEGELSITSGIVRGIIALSEQQGKALMKQEVILKFSQFFMSRKYVYTNKDMHSLLIVLAALSNNQHQVPVVLSVYEKNTITKEDPLLKIRVTNLLDQTIPDVKVTLKQFTSADDDVLFEDHVLQKSSEGDYIRLDNEIASGFIAAHVFQLDVISHNPPRGHYKAVFNVGLNNGIKKFVTGGTFQVPCSVLAKIAVGNVKIGTSDNDAKTATANTALQFMDKLDKIIDADYHQKILMTFVLTEMSSDVPVIAHQTFIRLVHEISSQEIFFVAESDSENKYKFTLDIGATAKDSFNNLSGNYKMSLLVGDSTIEVPIHWAIGTVSLKFKDDTQDQNDAQSLSPKPVIEHMFRIPEKRPSKIVSTIFTVLVFSPLLVMIGIWIQVGANLSNFQLTFSTAVFHVGLAGIFGLYYMFWIQFDMFQTLKLLVLVGGLTFLGGNSMLAKMAADRYRQ